MAQIVPLQAVPNQTLTVALDGQNCDLNVYQKNTGLFIDVLLSGIPVILDVKCNNADRIVRDAYLGFIGDFSFFDTQPDPVTGGADPDYTGLGGRFQLVYIEATD